MRSLKHSATEQAPQSLERKSLSLSRSLSHQHRGSSWRGCCGGLVRPKKGVGPSVLCSIKVRDGQEVGGWGKTRASRDSNTSALVCWWEGFAILQTLVLLLEVHGLLLGGVNQGAGNGNTWGTQRTKGRGSVRQAKKGIVQRQLHKGEKSLQSFLRALFFFFFWNNGGYFFYFTFTSQQKTKTCT